MQPQWLQVMPSRSGAAESYKGVAWAEAQDLSQACLVSLYCHWCTLTLQRALTGVAVYNFSLKDVPLRKMFLYTSLAGAVLGMTQILVITGRPCLPTLLFSTLNSATRLWSISVLERCAPVTGKLGMGSPAQGLSDCLTDRLTSAYPSG